MLDYNRLDMATLRLFKGLYVDEPNTGSNISRDEVVKLALNGLIFNTTVHSDTAVDIAIKLYGNSPYKLSNTFHKDWTTVENITPEEHYLQTFISYITTYGYDSLGIPYDENHYIIPDEIIPIPENVVPFNFTVISSLNYVTLLNRVHALVSSGVALSQQQVDDVLVIINYLQLPIDFSMVKNKEVRCVLWLGITGDKPYINVDEFLRVLVYTTLHQTLLVRSYRDYKAIRFAMNYSDETRRKVAKLLETYQRQFGIENLAGSFLRNKMLFLAFKCDETKVLINKLRRVADKYHKPLSNDKLTIDDILRAADNKNIFQLVKYYNYCLSVINPTEDRVYAIRNGKNYLASNPNYNNSSVARDLVVPHYMDLSRTIVTKLEELLSNLKDKTFIIPEYVDYKVPSSLKRLASGVPEGTMIKFKEGDPFVVGVYWTNLEGDDNEKNRVDLDLHANSVNKSIGWNTSFRNDEVLYSGDIVDAPISKGGASEALMFRKVTDPYLVTLNSYNQAGVISYKFVFDVEDGFRVSHSTGWDRRTPNGYIFTPNARVLNAKIKKDGSQNTLGLVMNDRFYFMNSSLFSGHVTAKSDLLKRAIKYYEESQARELRLRSLLTLVGARVFNSFEDLKAWEDFHEVVVDTNTVVDLSLEAITEDTFVQLFTIDAE